MPITKATLADVAELNVLINSAYRGEESKKGWTSEADLIGGIRIDEPMLTEYFNDDNITLLKHTDDDDKITGSVYLEVKDDKLYLGMFSVSPVLQGKGVGRALLVAAEDVASQLGLHTITMTVIRSRKELISWYERRGYTFTGEIQPFHAHGRFGEPKDVIIELIVMEKSI
ncbi:Acetyltransferase (GNAT) domain-containing protein [Mucilaginibacter pineti]|uniref:Acetyltransferase (GNAT) domain-containing protein n=1 Tax=Mucilaginibacter pineti TaxID=1391627 RepID=A0A1G6TE68_9SPHI|nr:GNAT family N-acetyltransferase [Mucilaginibacter pineti]SDD26806.1 Acetyltransferase (GNAT) domain-containing protein [Mucilaginibacter pineti]